MDPLLIAKLELFALRAAAIAALLLGCWWAGDRHGHQVEQAEQAEARAVAREQVNVKEAADRQKAQEADRAQESQRVALQRALDQSRSLVQQLRDATTGAGNLPGAAANPGLAAYAADGDRLLAECADRYSEVDGAKAGLARRLGGLQRLVQPPDAAASSVQPQEVTP